MSSNPKSPKPRTKKVRVEKAEAAPKETQKQRGPVAGKRKVGQRGKNFHREIQNLFRIQMGDNTAQRMSKNAKEFLDKFAKTLLSTVSERILLLHSVSKGVGNKNSTKTLSVKYVRSAIFSLFDHEGFSGVDKFAQKAVQTFEAASPSTKDGKGKKVNKISMKEKTGLNMPAHHVRNTLRKLSSLNRIGAKTIIYLTAVLEYCLSDLLVDSFRFKDEFSTAKAKKNSMVTQKYTAMALYKHSSYRNLFWRSIDGLGVEKMHHEAKVKDLMGTDVTEEKPKVKKVRKTKAKTEAAPAKVAKAPKATKTVKKAKTVKKSTSAKKSGPGRKKSVKKAAPKKKSN